MGMRKIHYAWVVTFLTFFTIVIAAGIRATSTVLFNPLEMEFGWTRTIIAGSISVNLLMFGIAAPISGFLIDRFGPRRVMLGSLGMLIIGLAGVLVMVASWQFFILWGVVVGMSSGALGTVITATVANRWFITHRGLAIGILSSSNSIGQMIFVPLLMFILLTFNWRVGSIVMMATSAGFIRDSLGDYQVAFYIGGLLAVIAGVLALGSLLKGKMALKSRAAV